MKVKRIIFCFNLFVHRLCSTQAQQRLNNAYLTRSSLFGLVHPVEDSVARVELDGGEDGLPSRGGRCGNGNGSGGNGGVGGRSDGTNEVGSSVGNRGNLGGPPGAADHTVAEVVGNVGHAVVARLVHVGVAAGDAVAVGSAALLGGVVDVLVAVRSVAGLVLGPVLAAGHLGGNGSDCNRGNRGSHSSHSKRGSSVVSCRGKTKGRVGSVGSRGVAKAGVGDGDRILGGGGGQGGGEQGLISELISFVFTIDIQRISTKSI